MFSMDKTNRECRIFPFCWIGDYPTKSKNIARYDAKCVTILAADQKQKWFTWIIPWNTYMFAKTCVGITTRQSHINYQFEIDEIAERAVDTSSDSPIISLNPKLLLPDLHKGGTEVLSDIFIGLRTCSSLNDTTLKSNVAFERHVKGFKSKEVRIKKVQINSCFRKWVLERRRPHPIFNLASKSKECGQWARWTW